MSSDTPPPQKLQLLHVNSNSPQSSASALHSMPTSDHSSRPGSADPAAVQGPAAGNELQSQPMTATSSTDAAGSDSANNLIHYGTRSRGRNAAPRPNYAEDRDIDMDLELSNPAPKSAKRSGGATPNNVLNGSRHEGEKMSSYSRKGQSTTSGASPASKDSIPGTSSFSAKMDDGNGGSNSSKKRKQPASAPNSNVVNGNVTKKIFTSAPGFSQDTETNMVTFETHGTHLKDGKLKADDGTVYAANDHVYLICEPPGEPYYLARIMEFLPSKESRSGPIEMLRVNWYYRPRDILRQVADTRVVFASMHSDTCPLSSLRGKCQIRHLSDIGNIEEYRKQRDSFWFDKMFDRYIHRYYEVVPTSKVINVPGNVKKVLDERWKFVLVEIGKRKELTSAVKTCKRCSLYAASTDSVDCAVCHFTYHMYCVRPPLTRKPARGFAWACAACSRAQERKLEARQTPIVGGSQQDVEEEVHEEEEEELNGQPNGTTSSTPAPVGEAVPHPATEEQIAQAKLWPYRYLGIHCQLEDALDYDDRIYPRASSRLGPRHQANVAEWPGRPVAYVKPVDIKKKYMRTSGGRKDGKLSKEAIAALEAAKQEKARRPKHIMDEPPGYVQRGEDEPVPMNGREARTAELLFKMPTSTQIPARGEDDGPGADLSPADREKFIDDYMTRAKEIAPEKGLEKFSTNFLDKALELLYAESFDVDAALKRLKGLEKHSDFKEPHLRPEELKLFEQAVGKYGSELRNVTKHVKTVPHYQIVRFYYMWKKTPRGRQIWGNYEGRRGKKAARRTSTTAKLVDDIADDHDDSAFDIDKAVEKKRGFTCKFCSTRSSRQWRRAPGVAPGAKVASDSSSKRDKIQLQVALCLRCAMLWRKYGIQWEDVDEVVKKISQSGNKSLRRRVDEELLAQLLVAGESAANGNSTGATAASLGVPVNPSSQAQLDPSRKKGRDKDSAATSTATSVEPAPKKKTGAEKVAEPPPIVPDPPKAKTLPCAICTKTEPMGDEHLSCRDCRLTVHRSCYGVSPAQNGVKWVCDMCSNDRNPMISTHYGCVLCPITWTEHDLMEAPPRTHKKKSERDREKERLEREMVAEAVKLYRLRQEGAGKPIGPREPLKRTVGNNWVHVTCAVWTPEIKFGNAQELEPAEGFGLIPADRYREVCKVCKTNQGSCVTCHFNGCNAQFHIGCAFQARYRFGFDVTPVKSSRRDTISSMRLGDEVGSTAPAIWCPHHAVSSIVHGIGEITGQHGLNALQLFCQTYKQADLALTGTVRKAAHVQQSVGASQNAISYGTRRASSTNGITPHPGKNHGISPEDEMEIDSEPHGLSRPVTGTGEPRMCCRCSTEFSPRWWPVGRAPRPPVLNGVGMSEPVRFPTAASTPFHARTPSQNSFTKANGDYVPDGLHAHQYPTTYECHKCHIKNPAPPGSPEPRPSPYSSQRPVLPAPRASDYHGHPYGSHAHPPAAGILARPMGGAPPQGNPEMQPGFDQRTAEYGDSGFRNGVPPPGYHGVPPQMNGYQPPPHVPGAPPHYPAGAPTPIPQSYPAHPSPYGPVAVPSPHPPHGLSARPYGPSASPPEAQTTIVRQSPQHSLNTLNGGPSPRVYAADRVLSAPAQSPPVSQADPRGPTPPGRLEDTPVSAPAGGQVNGAGGGSGASASPSLKNLLS